MGYSQHPSGGRRQTIGKIVAVIEKAVGRIGAGTAFGTGEVAVVDRINRQLKQRFG